MQLDIICRVASHERTLQMQNTQLNLTINNQYIQTNCSLYTFSLTPPSCLCCSTFM